MRLLLPHQIRDRLTEELRIAGTREIGGILMGEHLGEDLFQVVDLTVQRRGGFFATFLRSVAIHRRALARFFDRTGHDYTRFNYLGEWHSHPSFALVPSATDLASIREIVNDPTAGANFVVLLIVRLSPNGELETAGTIVTGNGALSVIAVSQA